MTALSSKNDYTLDPDVLEALEGLAPDEAAEYIELLEQILEGYWRLSPKQILAEELWGKCDWMLYGGAAGGGKSELASYHADKLSQTVPGHVTLLLRQSIPELRRSLILRLVARVKQFDIPARLRKVDGVTGFHYKNGSLIECGYLATDEHLGNYLSAEYDAILIDEATQMTKEQITIISGRLRTTRRKAALGARPHLGLFTNPGDVSHAFMCDVFVGPTDYGRKIVVYNVVNGVENAVIAREYEAPIPLRDATDEQITEVLIPWARELEVEVDPQTELAVGFVPSRATDNPHIDPGYLKFLNALPEKRRKQLRDGDWEVFEGQYFTEWDRNVHVIEPFDIPSHWPRARGADYGSSKPWACLWGAWDDNGDCYVYREAYGAGLTPERQARDAVTLSKYTDLTTNAVRKEKYERSVADPSVFSSHVRGVGRTIAQMWADNGFQVSRAKNDRIAGWANVRQYLWDYTRGELDANGDPLGAPRVFILSNCVNLIRTIPQQQHDKNKPEDVDTDGEDHACDALRYLLAVRPLGRVSRTVKVGQSLDQRFQAMILSHDKKKKRRWF